MLFISIVIVIIGIANVVLFKKESSESQRLYEDRLILRDLKVKFEILGPMTEDTRAGRIFGSPLKLEVYSTKDTLLNPFYLYAPTVWDVSILKSNQVKVNIFFNSDPETPLIGKRMRLLERYDAIKFPAGLIVDAMGLETVGEVIKVTLAIYVNAIEVHRMDASVEDWWGDRELKITSDIVCSWLPRSIRNIEMEYLNALEKSVKVE